MNKKNIAICGATGRQGGAVLRHTLKHPELTTAEQYLISKGFNIK